MLIITQPVDRETEFDIISLVGFPPDSIQFINRITSERPYPVVIHFINTGGAHAFSDDDKSFGITNFVDQFNMNLVTAIKARVLRVTIDDAVVIDADQTIYVFIVFSQQ